MEAAVEFIGLDYNEVGVGEDIVVAIVLGDKSEEGIAVEMTLVHDVGTHSGCRGLTMCSCHTKSLVGLGQCAQYLSALLYLETIITEEH